MARTSFRRRAAQRPAAADLDAELDRIARMNIEALRALWRKRRGSEPPQAFSKDLMVRTLAYWLQEERLGGLAPQLRKLLTAVAKNGSAPRRHLKVGSVIVREYEGTVHQVMVVPNGFCWQGQTYSSLSTIALKITGTSWNGPRFFGLRGDGAMVSPSLNSQKTAPTLEPRNGGSRPTVGPKARATADQSRSYAGSSPPKRIHGRSSSKVLPSVEQRS